MTENSGGDQSDPIPADPNDLSESERIVMMLAATLMFALFMHFIAQGACL